MIACNMHRMHNVWSNLYSLATEQYTEASPLVLRCKCKSNGKTRMQCRQQEAGFFSLTSLALFKLDDIISCPLLAVHVHSILTGASSFTPGTYYTLQSLLRLTMRDTMSSASGVSLELSRLKMVLDVPSVVLISNEPGLPSPASLPSTTIEGKASSIASATCNCVSMCVCV